MTSNKALGKMGEEAARHYLESIGYRIIDTNYRNRLGEIDIIGFDDGVLAFIEVKTRKSTRYGTPGQAVDAVKQCKITRTALAYLARSSIIYHQVRFDVVEIIARDDGVKQIRLVKDAFEAR